MTDSRQSLRRKLREARRALTPRQQRDASRALERLLGGSMLFLRSRHIAFYLANDGEIDPQRLLQKARRQGKHCYLPVVAGWPRRRMQFQRLTADTRWHTNRFGIREPVANPRQQVALWRLQLLLMPLVGFDAQGNRLGMGGGFYDRALAWRRLRRNWPGPQLVGLAHHCQQVDRLPIADWDIPADLIASDRQLLFKGR
ncbi:5-formyltetrahydrofolate cyclo-ligase [Halopseudomonas yangmingensis]|uniref:5-formyltetrahydrofolate cyclo-ligase n=1 Tax=Halopseudomonas yangmingensis TaxID=1720063 RepID=A0A1I4THR5_9GAMM|nr:5-formyltetrahydrofolate cyclo-ligase [Halopseudomonas yangmingensis]SFM76107.1 5-formyltetrahydrofolate cyclo-ligase [Halopseudomonas yangmingensis]